MRSKNPMAITSHRAARRRFRPGYVVEKQECLWQHNLKRFRTVLIQPAMPIGTVGYTKAFHQLNRLLEPVVAMAVYAPLIATAVFDKSPGSFASHANRLFNWFVRHKRRLLAKVCQPTMFASDRAEARPLYAYAIVVIK